MLFWQISTWPWASSVNGPPIKLFKYHSISRIKKWLRKSVGTPSFKRKIIYTLKKSNRRNTINIFRWMSPFRTLLISKITRGGCSRISWTKYPTWGIKLRSRAWMASLHWITQSMSHSPRGQLQLNNLQEKEEQGPGHPFPGVEMMVLWQILASSPMIRAIMIKWFQNASEILMISIMTEEAIYINQDFKIKKWIRIITSKMGSICNLQ